MQAGQVVVEMRVADMLVVFEFKTSRVTGIRSVAHETGSAISGYKFTIATEGLFTTKICIHGQ